MSIKNLFGKTSRNLEETVQDVESVKFVEEKTKKQDRYLPPIDFSDPSNFAYYGSAELYYQAAIKRIYEDYPYDGSKSEQIEFEEKASHLERWLFENKYPKTTGYVEMGTTNDLVIGGQFSFSNTPEYIRVWGGLHTQDANTLQDKFDKSAKYDENKNRNQNWNCNFEEGVTVEFFLQKDFFHPDSKEVILDLWNGQTGASEGRLVLMAVYDTTNAVNSMILYVKSGTVTTGEVHLIPGILGYSIDFGSWAHYSVSLKQIDGELAIKFYINGNETSFQYAAGTFATFSGKVDGFIGALQTSLLGNGALSHGKLQAKMDEFRFWKTCRTSRQIKLNWFSQVGGGANTDDATSNLGVYFKFNEGIVGNSITDSVILDYSGRMANGYWVGYPGSSARSTDSAIELAGYSENPTPIIYSEHSDVSNLISEMMLSGAVYDAEKGQSFYSSMPNWLLQSDNGEFRNISHILASYLDTLHVQIKNLTELKNKQYTPEEFKANTLASELLKEKGFLTPNLFESSEVYEKLSDLNIQDNQFQKDLSEIKNIIYTNIYNNLEKIYKSKGTEGSIRNLIRCFGIDDELIKLNLYTDGGIQYLSDKYRTTSVKKKYINFNNPNYFSSTIYQTSSPSNLNTFISSFVDGSKNAFTLEADIVVPYKKEIGEKGYFNTPFLSSSVFGFHEANPSNPSDLSWYNAPTIDPRDLQVYLVKDSQNSRNAKFVLKNEVGTINLESSWIYDIYTNEHYNVAIRIKPQTYPYAGGVTNLTPDYDVELYAVSNNFGEIKEEVLLSTTLAYSDGSAYISAAKRVYAGAHLIDFVGAVDEQCDVEIGAIRGWLDYLSNEEIFEHNKDILNHGAARSIDGANLYTIDDVQIPSQELTILNWDFDTVTSSDGSGNFDVEDLTSGSTDTIYGWIDDVIRREHKGVGFNFPVDDNRFLSNEFLFAKKKQLPETSFNSENIFIKGEQEINFSDDEDVSDNLFILEKSPSALVSEEMLKSFSTTMEFANLFGRPIDRFRIEYKDLARARELFFQRVESDLDFDRFFEYFKWIDSSISQMVNQLIPLSANFAGGIVDVIEPHILERDKYQRQVGLLNTVTSTEASIRGQRELSYNWRIGRAPIPVIEPENSNPLWQKERRERDTDEQTQINKVLTRENDQEFSNPVVLSGSDGHYSGSYAIRRFSKSYSLGVDFRNSIHGGINYNKGKNRDFLSTTVTPQGSLGSSGAPENIMTIGAGDGNGLVATGSYLDYDPNELIKRDGYAQIGKFSSFSNYESKGVEFDYMYRQKVSDVFIGNIVSSSVTTGYSSVINKGGSLQGFAYDVDIVNLHSDTTDITNEIPIQGPFTQEHIGGHQGRHVYLNKIGRSEWYPNEPDNSETRPEAWRLLVGTNPLADPSDADGAIGFTGPDYGAYPVVENQKAVFYREERAKRPVNIKNIQTIIGTGSHGNFTREYEVLSTFGDQGYYLRRADSLLPQIIEDELPQTTNYLTLVAQTPTEIGNIFGQPNNRFFDLVPAVSTQQAVGFFIVHDNMAGGITPSDIATFTMRIARADGTTVTFIVTDNGGGTSGTLIATETVVDTGGSVTWSTLVDEFKTAIEHPTNGFGTDVTVVRSYDASGPYGEQVTIFVTENTLIGSLGNGGLFSDDTPSPNLEIGTASFEGGVDSESEIPRNIVDTQDRATGSMTTIRTRFSAPGGPEINTSAYLDVATQQYSVHNSLNYRNLTVRMSGSGEQDTIRVDSHSGHRDGLRTLRTRHQGQFGVDSLRTSEASWHKQHRNSSLVPIPTYDLAGNQISDTSYRFDNDNYNRPLPATDFQYSWIKNSVTGDDVSAQLVLDRAPRNGMMSSFIGYHEAIFFPAISNITCENCTDITSLTTTITYKTSDGETPQDITVNVDTQLDVVNGPVSNTGEIFQDEVENMILDYTYSGCCTDGFQFKLDYNAGAGWVYGSYSSTKPIIPSVVRDTGEVPGDVILVFTVKDCQGTEDSITITLKKAKLG